MKDRAHDQPPPSDGPANTTSRKSRTRRRMLWLPLILVMLWLAGDLVYAQYVQFRIRHWEETIEYNSDGVRKGCEAFTLGDTEAREAILLVHGLNDSPACWRLLAPHFEEAGYYCQAIRLDGFGETTMQYAQGRRETWLRQIAEALRTLKARHQRVHIAGHSLGGALSILHLCDHPDAADSIVLVAPGVNVSNARSPVLSTRAWHSVANALLLSTRITASPFGIDAAQISEDDYPYRTTFTPRVIFDESFAVIDAIKGREQDFRTPVLLAVSRNDRVIDPEAAASFVKASAAPIKEIEYFDDSGHALLVDHTAERLAQRMLKFYAAY